MDTAGLPKGDPYAPYRRVGFVLAGLIVVLSGVEIVRNAIAPTSVDFLSFWGAGKLALAGTPALAYDPAAIHAVQVEVASFDGGEMAFPYAPAFMLIVAPFALCPFPLAMALWSASTLALYVAVARRFAPHARWLTVAFPPVFVIASIGQNGFLTGAAFLGGLVLLQRERSFAAGLAFGCLILKPQLAPMLPVAMLAARDWRAIAGGALSSAGLMLAGVAAFGPDVSRAWIDQMPLYVEAGRNGLAGWHKLVSVYAAARQAGLSEQAALVLHGAVAAVAAVLVARIWRSKAEPLARAGILGAASMLASPYLFLYDSLVLIPAFAWLVHKRTSPAIVGLLWLIPIVSVAQAARSSGPINIGPLLPIALLVLCSRTEPERRRFAIPARRVETTTAG